jgi:hypothetical protein
MILYQDPNHRLYRDIDWDRLNAAYAAVVDPLDPASIMYLSEREYNKTWRTAASSDLSLKVLAKAGDKPEVVKGGRTGVRDDKQTPPIQYIMGGSIADIESFFKKFRSTLSRARVKDASLRLNERNLRLIIHKWTYQVHLWSGGSLSARGLR